MTDTQTFRSIAMAAFDEIRRSVPEIEMEVSEDHPHVDLWMEAPVQRHLEFAVSMNLQHDELHLNAGEGFWVEWFPCTKPDRTAAYVAAVVGLLQGTLRIVEHWAFGRVVVAQLQEPQGPSWRTIATWSNALTNFRWPWRSIAVLQNASYSRTRRSHS